MQSDLLHSMRDARRNPTEWPFAAVRFAWTIERLEDDGENYVITGRVPLSPYAPKPDLQTPFATGPQLRDLDLLSGHDQIPSKDKDDDEANSSRVKGVHVRFANASTQRAREEFLGWFGPVKASRIEKPLSLSRADRVVVAHQSKKGLDQAQREFSAAARLLVLLNLEGDFDASEFVAQARILAEVASERTKEKAVGWESGDMKLVAIAEALRHLADGGKPSDATPKGETVRLAVSALMTTLERFRSTLIERTPDDNSWELHEAPLLDGTGILPLLWAKLRRDALATRPGAPCLRICARKGGRIRKDTHPSCARFFTVTRRGKHRPQLWCSEKCSWQARNLEDYYEHGADARRRRRKRELETASRRPRRDSRPR